MTLPFRGVQSSTGASIASQRVLRFNVGPALGCGLAVVAPIWLAGPDLLNWGVAGIMLIIFSAVAGVEVARELVRDEPRPVRGMAWLFTYIWMCLSPLASMRLGVFPWESSFSSAAILRGTLIVALGMACFSFAYRLQRPPKPRLRSSSRALISGRLAWLFVITAVVSVVIIVDRAGVRGLFADRLTRSSAVMGTTVEAGYAGEDAGGTGTFLALLTEIPPFAVLLLAAAAVGAVPGVRRNLTRFESRWIIAAWLFLLVIINPLSSARFWFGAVNIALVMALSRRAASIRRLFLGTLLGVVLVFPYLDYWRLPHPTFSGFNAVHASLGTDLDFDAFAMAMDGYGYTDLNGFRWGTQLLSSATFFAPRAVWPGKPHNTSTVIREGLPSAHARTDNFSVPLWAELYIDGGIPLVAAGLSALGALAAWLDQRLRPGTSPLSRALLASFLGLELFILRGGLSAAVSRLGFVYLAIVAVYIVCSRKVSTRRDVAQVPSPLASAGGG